MRRSATHVVERDSTWKGDFETEPWETAWAAEAIFFVRLLKGQAPVEARVQISPDGMHWLDEGSQVTLPLGQQLAFVRVREFGAWLRLAGTLPEGREARVIVYLSLKE